MPVIFLSIYGQDEVIVQAFEMGGADYIVKPFSPTELVARIRSALRRQVVPSPPPESSEPYLLGDLVIDYATRAVTVAGLPVELTATEYRVLAELATNGGRVMTHEQLLSRVWGEDYAQGVGPLRSMMRHLRRKLGDNADDPRYIHAKHGLGYVMGLSGEC